MAWHQLIYLNIYTTIIVHVYFALVLKIFLAVPRSRLKTYGDRAFSVVAPRLCNKLPLERASVTSVDRFKTQLKAYLFKLAYDV